jgi:PIN domain nuclease of toxin-antitoxin system
VAAVIYLDTHVVAWLYAGRTDLIPPAVRNRIEREPLLVSPVVALELQYLFEVGKTTEPGEAVLRGLRRDLALSVCDLPFELVVRAALREDWTRDPFDRLIASQASLRPAPLATKDRGMRANCAQAFWD